MAKNKGQMRQTHQDLVQQEDLQPLIAQKAYELWEQSGRMEGRDWENWLEAERLVRGLV